MPRGNAPQTKIHYQGKDEDFIVFVENKEELQKWKGDKSIPLAEVMSGFKVFVTNKHGNQGILDGASNAQLDNEFGTHRDDDVVKKILEEGKIIETEEHGRQGDKNITQGGSVAH